MSRSIPILMQRSLITLIMESASTEQKNKSGWVFFFLIVKPSFFIF